MSEETEVKKIVDGITGDVMFKGVLMIMVAMFIVSFILWIFKCCNKKAVPALMPVPIPLMQSPLPSPSNAYFGSQEDFTAADMELDQDSALLGSLYGK